MAAETPTFSLVIVGSAGSGKSTYFRRVGGAPTDLRYLPTIGAETRVVPVPTTRGDVNVRLRYCVGRTPPGQHRGSFFHFPLDGSGACDAVLIFFDLTRRITWREAREYLREAREHKVTGPVVLVGNKADCFKIKRPRREYHDPYDYDFEDDPPAVRPAAWYWGVPYVEISARNGFNIDMPLLLALQQLHVPPDLSIALRQPLPFPDPMPTELTRGELEGREMFGPLLGARAEPAP